MVTARRFIESPAVQAVTDGALRFASKPAVNWLYQCTMPAKDPGVRDGPWPGSQPLAPL